MKKTPALLVLCLMLAAVSLPAAANGADDADDSNVLVTVRVSSTRSPEPEIYRTIVRFSNTPTRLMAGHRIPIPVSKLESPPQSGSGRNVPVTSFIYQNVGFEARFVAGLTLDGKISIDGNLEHSRLSGTTDGDQPIIQARQSSFKVKLTQRQPLRILVASDGEGGEISYELEAEIVD